MNTLSTHHKLSVVIPQKRRFTKFYIIKLYQYNNLINQLQNPSEFTFLDNVENYIVYSQKQTKSARSHLFNKNKWICD